jgi:hypothetical protein
MSSEGEDFHKTELRRHCRFCGKLCSSGETKYNVVQHRLDLQAVSGLPLESDDPAIHPQEFCHSCYCSMKRSTSCSPMIWNKHTSENIHIERCRMSSMSGSVGQTSPTPMWSTMLHIMCVCMGTTHSHTGPTHLSLLYSVASIRCHPDHQCSSRHTEATGVTACLLQKMPQNGDWCSCQAHKTPRGWVQGTSGGS